MNHWIRQPFSTLLSGGHDLVVLPWFIDRTGLLEAMVSAHGLALNLRVLVPFWSNICPLLFLQL